MDDFREDAAQDYFGTTVVHPVGMTVLVLLCAVMFLVPRRWMFAPMIVLACFIAPAQRVMLGGFNWDFARILVPIANLARLIVLAKPVAGGVRVLLTGRR